MAASFSDNPTLPNPLKFLAGQSLTDVEFQRLAELANWNLAHSGAGPVWAQSWPSGIEIGDDGAVCDAVKVPYVSGGFTSYRVTVGATVTGGDNLGLRLEGIGGSGDVLITSSGTWVWTAPYGAYRSGETDTPDLITLRALSGEGLLKSITVELVPLSSPLSSGGIDVSLIDEGDPVAYEHAHALIDAAQECRMRPKVLSAWSSTVLSTKWVDYAPASVHGGFAYAHLGQDLTEINVFALVSNAGTTYESLRIGRGGEGIAVPPGSDRVWVSGTVNLRSLRTGDPDLISPSWSCVYSTPGDLWELQDPSVYPSGKHVAIHSITVWGR